MKVLLVLALAAGLSSCASIKKGPKVERKLTDGLDWTRSIQKYEIRPGEVVPLFLPWYDDDIDVTLECKGKELVAYRNTVNTVAYLSETYFSKLKPYKCHYKYDGKKVEVADIKVVLRKYPEEKLNVDKKRVFLSKKDLARVMKEQKALNKIYASSEGRPLFSVPFKQPLNSYVTSRYGTRRLFNNKKRTQHLGTDFRAAIGVPITSANAGKVVLAQELFYTGNTVIIDHGLGIFTVYGHLSEIKTQVGEYLPKDFLLGLAGMTGRVTGPHLHWGVKVHGNWIDGASLVKATEKIKRL